MTFPRFLLLAGLSFAGLGTLVAQKPRIATVDASELFAKYYRTATEKAKLAEEQKKIAHDPRTAVIARTINELRDLEKQVRNSSNSEDSREEFFRKFQMKSHELRSLQRDTTQHRQDRQKEINRKLVSISKILLSEVQSTVQHVAAAGGYDMVIDISGDTSSQVPTLLYIRNSTDLTAKVLAELNRTKPDDLPEGVTPSPANATPPGVTASQPTPPPPGVIPTPPPMPPAPAPAPAPVPEPAPAPVPEPAPASAPVPAPGESPTIPSVVPATPAPSPPAPTPIPRAVRASEDE